MVAVQQKAQQPRTPQVKPQKVISGSVGGFCKRRGGWNVEKGEVLCRSSQEGQQPRARARPDPRSLSKGKGVIFATSEDLHASVF